MEVSIVPYLVHRNPDFWPDPEKFLPERFYKTEINSNKRHPFAYLPFSGGLRNCIGRNFALLEAKIIISKLIQNFEFTLDTAFEPKPLPEVTLRPKNLRLFVKPRKK